MTTLTNVLAPVARAAKNMTGEALRRSHYTQAMSGSSWRTLIGFMVEAQADTCAICGTDGMRQARATDPKAITLHRLLSGEWFGSEADRMTTQASNGKPLDCYRYGFVPGNVVAAHEACSSMVYGEKPTEDRLGILPSQIITEWTPEMRRPAKVKAPTQRNDMRRALQARGWMAEG